MDLGNFGLSVHRRLDVPGGVKLSISTPELGEVITLNLDAAMALRVGLWWMNAISSETEPFEIGEQYDG